MAGENNILFEGYLYKTLTSEMAISVWSIIVLEKLERKLMIEGVTHSFKPFQKKFSKFLKSRNTINGSKSTSNKDEDVDDYELKSLQEDDESKEIEVI
jgi:hypothetical protein